MKYVLEGEIATTFDDVAEEAGNALEVEGHHQKETASLIRRKLGKMTISDIVREAIRCSSIEEVKTLIEIMEDAQS
jgi:hypothetical protein